MREPYFRVDNWRALRDALGLTQVELSRMLCISERELQRLEAGAHQAREGTLFILRIWLEHDEAKRRLADAGIPHPFAEAAEVA